MKEESASNIIWKLIDCRSEVLAYVRQRQSADYPNKVIGLAASRIASLFTDKTLSFKELAKSYLFNLRSKEQLHFFYGISRDQFAPKYYYDVLFNLYSLRDKIEAGLDKLEPMMDDYMAFEELLSSGAALDARQHKQKDKFEKAFLDFWLNYRKVVSVVGGLFMLEHFDDFLPKMIEKYHLCCKRINMYRTLSKLNDKLLSCYDSDNNPLPNKLKQIKKIGIKVDGIQGQIKSLDHQIWFIERTLDDLRAFYKDEPAFQMHERYRDEGLCLNYLSTKELKILQSEILAVVVNEKQLNHKLTETELLAKLRLFKEDILLGRKQVLQQTEIQSLYNYLAEFCEVLNLTAISLLYQPACLTKRGRQNVGKKFLHRRPKVLLWQNISEQFHDNELAEHWLFLLKVLSEQENVLNVLVDNGDGVFADIEETIELFVEDDKLVRSRFVNDGTVKEQDIDDDAADVKSEDTEISDMSYERFDADEEQVIDNSEEFTLDKHTTNGPEQDNTVVSLQFSTTEVNNSSEQEGDL